MSWDEIGVPSTPQATREKQAFVTFPEGITRIRVITEQPHIRWTHWMPQFKRSVNCPGMNVCPICKLTQMQKKANEKATYSTQKKHSLVVINRETAQVEIMDQGKEFFEDLKDLRADYGDLRAYDIKVKRRGTTQDGTSYRLDKEDEVELTDADKALIAKAVDLNEYFKPHPPEILTRLLAGEPFDVVMADYAKSLDDANQNTSGSTQEEYEVE